MTRFAILLTGYCAIGALALPAVIRPVPRLVWNASASVPLGLYASRPPERVDRGDLVAAFPPEPIARMMAERGYLPLRLPMLKQVAALPGQTICRNGNRVSIDGKLAAVARARDRAGRPLAAWSGCRTLRADEVFLLNRASADSFDGRYFGALPLRSVTAVLTPLWVSAPAPERPAPVPQTNTQGA